MFVDFLAERWVLLMVLGWAIVGGCIGALIGKPKGRMDEGAILGIFLGAIGWILVALGPDKNPKCPHCGGVVVAGVAKCKCCGSDLGEGGQ